MKKKKTEKVRKDGKRQVRIERPPFVVFRCRTVHKKEIQNIGVGFQQLGQSLNNQIPALEMVGD